MSFPERATVNPDRRGTKMACQYKLEAGPGQELELRLRLTRDGAAAHNGPRQGA